MGIDLRTQQLQFRIFSFKLNTVIFIDQMAYTGQHTVNGRCQCPQLLRHSKIIDLYQVICLHSFTDLHQFLHRTIDLMHNVDNRNCEAH